MRRNCQRQRHGLGRDRRTPGCKARASVGLAMALKVPSTLQNPWPSKTDRGLAVWTSGLWKNVNSQSRGQVRSINAALFAPSNCLNSKPLNAHQGCFDSFVLVSNAFERIYELFSALLAFFSISPTKENHLNTVHFENVKRMCIMP